MLLIENIQGTLRAVPINLSKRKLDRNQVFEFWDDDSLCSFVFAYERNPFAACFAYESTKLSRLLKEVAGITYD